MRLVKEDLWENPGHPGMIVVTTNSYINRQGKLVMGRGAAYEATLHIPGIAYEAAKVVKAGEPIKPFFYRYGFAVLRDPFREGKLGFGIFQVKYHYWDQASLELIQESISDLYIYARTNPTVKIRMNFPGIGYGGLSWDDVYPLVEALPNNVTVCHHTNGKSYTAR